MKQKNFVITKRIAKHGKQAIIVVPKLIEGSLKPGTIVKATLEIIKFQPGGQNEQENIANGKL
jgi:hypothetical protein